MAKEEGIILSQYEYQLVVLLGAEPQTEEGKAVLEQNHQFYAPSHLSPAVLQYLKARVEDKLGRCLFRDR